MSIFLILFLNINICYSQNTSIKITGKLFDNDLKPISSAHLVINEASIGTLSSKTGYFELKIPKRYCSSDLIISHVGYQSVSYKMSCKDETNLIFNLTESTTQLDSLNIGDISARQVVLNTIQNLEKNHEVEAVTYKVFGRLEENIGGELDLLESLWQMLIMKKTRKLIFKF